MTWANKITGPNAGGPRQFPIRTPLAARVGQFWRSAATHSMSHRVAKFIQRLSGTTPCPEIRWQEVVRIEAMGTDTFSAFQIWLTFIHSDGTKAEATIETSGYWDIVDSLHTRFPSIPATWRDEMSEQQWHVERVLYSRHGNMPEQIAALEPPLPVSSSGASVHRALDSLPAPASDGGR